MLMLEKSYLNAMVDLSEGIVSENPELEFAETTLSIYKKIESRYSSVIRYKFSNELESLPKEKLGTINDIISCENIPYVKLNLFCCYLICRIKAIIGINSIKSAMRKADNSLICSLAIPDFLYNFENLLYINKKPDLKSLFPLMYLNLYSYSRTTQLENQELMYKFIRREF